MVPDYGEFRAMFVMEWPNSTALEVSQCIFVHSVLKTVSL